MLRKNRKIEDGRQKAEDRRQVKGFTLIELLVVIAIVGLLGALIVPAIGTSKDRAKEAICVNNLRQLGIAANVYFDEQNGKIPTAADTKRYIDDNRVYICPNDKRADIETSYEVWGLTKWDYVHGSIEKNLMSNTSEQALFVETNKVLTDPTDPDLYPMIDDLAYRHRNGDRLVVLFCDNHALSLSQTQSIATLGNASLGLENMSIPVEQVDPE